MSRCRRAARRRPSFACVRAACAGASAFLVLWPPNRHVAHTLARRCSARAQGRQAFLAWHRTGAHDGTSLAWTSLAMSLPRVGHGVGLFSRRCSSRSPCAALVSVRLGGTYAGAPVLSTTAARPTRPMPEQKSPGYHPLMALVLKMPVRVALGCMIRYPRAEPCKPRQSFGIPAFTPARPDCFSHACRCDAFFSRFQPPPLHYAYCIGVQLNKRPRGASLRRR